MPGDKFPYKSAFGHSIRDLWTRQAYEYLRRLCLTLEMDPTIADGKIKRGDENKPWGIPVIDPQQSGIHPFKALAGESSVVIAFGAYAVAGYGFYEITDNTSVTITGTADWVVLKIQKTDPSVSAFEARANAPDLANTTYHEFAICETTRSGTVVTVTRQHQTSNIYIGATL